MSERKVVQMFFETVGDSDCGTGALYSRLHARCDDGSIWYLLGERWELWDIPPVPGTVEVNEVPHE